MWRRRSNHGDWDNSGGPSSYYNNALSLIAASKVTGCRACLFHFGTNDISGSV
jgi:hypothetical protein